MIQSRFIVDLNKGVAKSQLALLRQASCLGAGSQFNGLLLFFNFLPSFYIAYVFFYTVRSSTLALNCRFCPLLLLSLRWHSTAP